VGVTCRTQRAAPAPSASPVGARRRPPARRAVQCRIECAVSPFPVRGCLSCSVLLPLMTSDRVDRCTIGTSTSGSVLSSPAFARRHVRFSHRPAYPRLVTYTETLAHDGFPLSASLISAVSYVRGKRSSSDLTAFRVPLGTPSLPPLPPYRLPVEIGFLRRAASLAGSGRRRSDSAAGRPVNRRVPNDECLSHNLARPARL